MPIQKAGNDGDGKYTDEKMDDGSSMLRYGEAYYALDTNSS